MAVTVCEPEASVVVEALVATPPDPSGTGPPKFAPSITNCTVPAGAPAPGEVTATVAVKLTAWPEAAGLALDAIAVVVAARLTDWARLADVLLVNDASPE